MALPNPRISFTAAVELLRKHIKEVSPMLHLYVEVLNRKHKWQMVHQENPQAHLMIPMRLTDLMHSSGPGTHPFSFFTRGMPAKSNLSEGVEAIYKDVENPTLESWRTLDELRSKLAELYIIPEPEARQFIPQLTELIRSLPAWHGDPKHQRIVYWGRKLSILRKKIA